MEIKPLPIGQPRQLKYKIQLNITLKNGDILTYTSKKEEIPFFHDANHLLYQMEYRNIQDIMHEKDMDDDIYNLFTYLWNRNNREFENYFSYTKIVPLQKEKNKNLIINFIQDTNNFDTPQIKRRRQRAR